jgi:hypothetical protein
LPRLKVLLCYTSNKVTDLSESPTRLPQLKVPLLKRFWSFLGVLAGFAVFLRWNGGVVLGDKSNHVTVLHPTQLLYLGLYVALNFAPALLWPDWCATPRVSPANANRYDDIEIMSDDPKRLFSQVCCSTVRPAKEVMKLKCTLIDMFPR